MANSLELASAVAKFVELRSVWLRTANLATAIDPLKLPASLEIQSRYRAQHDTSNAETLLVFIDLEFEAHPAGQAEPKGAPVVRLDATFGLLYDWKAGAEYPEGAVDEFARLNGAYNVWPYWRELVQTVSGRVGLAGIIVPVFRANDFELRFKGIADHTDGPSNSASVPQEGVATPG